MAEHNSLGGLVQGVRHDHKLCLGHNEGEGFHAVYRLLALLRRRVRQVHRHRFDVVGEGAKAEDVIGRLKGEVRGLSDLGALRHLPAAFRTLGVVNKTRARDGEAVGHEAVRAVPPPAAKPVQNHDLRREGRGRGRRGGGEGER